MEMIISKLDLLAILPETIITIVAVSVLIFDLLLPEDRKHLLGSFSIAGIVLAIISTFPLWGLNISVFGNMFIIDNYAISFKVIILIVAALTILISAGYVKIEKIKQGEYYSLLLFSTLGMMAMTSGNDLITIYIAFELMSLPLYLLAGFIRNDLRSGEAALKYLILGAFSSGIMLYGIALLYGSTGTTSLPEIGRYIAEGSITADPIFILSIVLLVVGFGFKFAAVPFHVWLPDVLEGSPTTVAAFMSVGPKAASIAAMSRILIVAVMALMPHWEHLFWILAALTMTFGNVSAVLQSNIKRMLAYSSIAQVGYMMIGLVALKTVFSLTGILVYLFAYTFMNIGAFSMVILLCREDRRGDQISDFTGLARVHPCYAAALVVFFLSLAGIPPTAGFVGKLLIFSAAIQAKLIWLAIIGVVNSVISLYYYFRVVQVMYMKEPEEEFKLSLSPALAVAISIMVFAVLAVGIFPSQLIEAARASALSIMGSF